MQRAFLAIVVLLLSGCTQTEVDGEGGISDAPLSGETFAPWPLTVGDKFQYAFGFASATFNRGGSSMVEVVEKKAIPDAAGRMREALFVRQGQPSGGFYEEYWLDAQTLIQFKHVRHDTYNETTRFPRDPLTPVPQRHAIYANASGIEERFLEDPLFEDINFYGGFLTGQPIPASGPINITGNMWQRNDTNLLRSGVWDAEASTPTVDETWGELRRVDATATFADDSGSETIRRTGSFSRNVPLAVEVVRQITAKFGSTEFDVRFNATLLAYAPGEGAGYVRQDVPFAAEPRALSRVSAPKAPADGDGARIHFPFSEALAALDKDPRAVQYLQAHPDAYVTLGHYNEVNTCGAYGTANPPGCRWLEWFGIHKSPTDDMSMVWTAEKYADNSGGGAAFIPAVRRDYPFDTVFDTLDGDTPQAPEDTVVVGKSSSDVLPRASFPSETLSMAQAVQVWRDYASVKNKDLTPNFVVFFLTPEGYGYFLDHYQWQFPTNPELFVAYDDAPMELSRHPLEMTGSGRVLKSVNWDVQVQQT